ncbi:MAG: prepilin peptidase [Lachnospiraceae bacterium]|nr:prepilin peptidase [Lachnospiraceae bacterium]
MAFLVGMAVTDIKSKKIPNIILIPALVPGFVRLFHCISLTERIADLSTAVVLYVFLLIIYVICKSQKKTFGGGDVKMIPETVIGLGTTVGLAGLFTGFLLLILIYGTKQVLKISNKEMLPLGPWIALGCIMVYFPLTA